MSGPDSAIYMHIYFAPSGTFPGAGHIYKYMYMYIHCTCTYMYIVHVHVYTLYTHWTTNFIHVFHETQILPCAQTLTCFLDILKAGASNERSKSTWPAAELRPSVTDCDVIMNSTTFPFKMVYTPEPNSTQIESQ